MATQLVDFVIDRFSAKVPTVRFVRYDTDSSWGASSVMTTTIHGETYDELFGSIETVIDIQSFSIIGDYKGVIGLSIDRIHKNCEKEFGAYLNLHFGDIKGGTELGRMLSLAEVRSKQTNTECK